MIKLKNITKFYKNDTNVSLGLRNINAIFNKGEFIAITGESGSGKSTLLNIISGFDSYQEGEMYFNDEPTSHFDKSDWEEYRNEKIGFIFQNYNLIDSYTVLENVLSTLYIQGYTDSTALEKAKKILDSVGLLNRINHKASHLSSGQKQRLSIARALAKDTEVIMADEPTGNLDSENGKEIIKLLYEISKEKLVIIVTHNYDEVKDYATKKIRMFDGEIQSIVVNKDISSDNNTVGKNKPKTNNIYSSDKNINKSARKLAFLNIKSQPQKVILLLFFFLITSFASYIFVGGIYSNLDDTNTKSQCNIFTNNQKNRIVVKRKDSKSFDENDIQKINEINHIIYLDKYDLSNEINYFSDENSDYTISINSDGIKVVSYKNNNKFLKNANFYKKQNLSCGKIPEGLYEVLLCSNDKNMLNKDIDIYIRNNKFWEKYCYIKIKMKIVGLVNSNTKELYFSDKFKKMANCSLYNSVNYFQYFTFNPILPASLESICIINPSLKNNEIKLQSKFPKEAKKQILENKDSKPSINTYDNNFKKILYENYCKKYEQNNINFKIVNFEGPSSKNIVELSENLFNRFYDTNTYQVSVFIDNIKNTERVTETLIKLGYKAVSPYKVNSNFYLTSKVRQRLMLLFVNIIALLITFTLEIVIIKALLKYKMKDFLILKLVGMKNKTVSKINYIEFSIYNLVSIILNLIIIFILNLCNISYVVNISNSYTIISYLIYFLLNIITLFILTFSYNKYLYKHFNITSLSDN